MKEKNCGCGHMRSGGTVCHKCGGKVMSFGGAVKSAKKYRDGGTVAKQYSPGGPVKKETNPNGKGSFKEYYRDSEGFPVVTLSDEEVNNPKESNYEDNYQSSKTSEDRSLPNWGRAKKEQMKLNELIRKDIAEGKKVELLEEDDIIGEKTLAAMNRYEGKGYTRPELFKDKWLAEYKKNAAAGIGIKGYQKDDNYDDQIKTLEKNEKLVQEELDQRKNKGLDFSQTGWFGLPKQFVSQNAESSQSKETSKSKKSSGPLLPPPPLTDKILGNPNNNKTQDQIIEEKIMQGVKYLESLDASGNPRKPLGKPEGLISKMKGYIDDIVTEKPSMMEGVLYEQNRKKPSMMEGALNEQKGKIHQESLGKLSELKDAGENVIKHFSNMLKNTEGKKSMMSGALNEQKGKQYEESIDKLSELKDASNNTIKYFSEMLKGGKSKTPEVKTIPTTTESPFSYKTGIGVQDGSAIKFPEQPMNRFGKISVGKIAAETAEKRTQDNQPIVLRKYSSGPSYTKTQLVVKHKGKNHTVTIPVSFDKAKGKNHEVSIGGEKVKIYVDPNLK